MNCKMMGMLLVASACIMFANLAYAEEQTSGQKQLTSELETKDKTAVVKEVRKKKVEICADCGRPETECDCVHAKDDQRDKPKSGEHSKGNGRNH